jgi:hypothetical protein
MAGTTSSTHRMAIAERKVLHHLSMIADAPRSGPDT